MSDQPAQWASNAVDELVRRKFLYRGFNYESAQVIESAFHERYHKTTVQLDREEILKLAEQIRKA